MLPAMAQEVVVVDSEKVFKSLIEYNLAMERIDALSKGYQADVDAKFEAVSRAFEEYAITKSSYTATQRKSAEAYILRMEQEATALQESYFAQDGIMTKTRLSLIAPIQTRVFTAIEKYAAQKGADIVIDKASNPTMLFSSDRVDCTETIIEMLK